MTGAHANGTNLRLNNTATDGDARVEFQLGGTTVWSVGCEDGDGDKFVIEDGAGALGAVPSFEITPKIDRDDATAGAGFDAVAVRDVYIYKLGGEIVTTIHVDLGDSVVQANNVSNGIIGEGNGTSDAYIYQLTNAKNGYVYKVEINCIEDTSGGNNQIGIITHDATLASGATGGTKRFDAFEETGIQGYSGSVAIKADIDNQYVFLYHNTAVSSSNAYTSGKFVIKFWGADF